MREQIEMVREFHATLGVSAPQQLMHEDLPTLERIARCVLADAKRMESDVSREDKRHLRAHLCTEELGELLSAMAGGYGTEEGLRRQEVAVLDALCDLMYVVLGTAITFDLPVVEGFAEVHRSNMTKRKQVNDPLSDRVREKGAGYTAPNLERVLREYRERT